MAERASRVSPAAVVACLAVAAGLAALVIALFASTKRRASYELCAGNLKLIDRALRVGELFDSPKWDAAGTGRALLARPDRWPVQVVMTYEPFCPVKGGEPREIDYRGPARPLREIRNDDPMLADRPGNHGPGQGGNVLLKSGDIHAVRETEALWARAFETTSD
jgi:hypothetical protein